MRRSQGDGGGRETTAAVWAAVSGLTIGEAWLRRDEKKSPETLAKFQDAMEDLARGVPFAYAVGRVGFRTLDLAIDRRALIPRPETEGLVELVLREAGTGGLAADIGTGSGCIALSLSLDGRFDRVIAVEQSSAAAALARENVARINPPVPVEVREGNLLAPLGDKGERYRVIVSNPPYLTTGEYQELDASVREFEPHEALVSGADGLDVTRELLAGAATLLEPGGMLALEIDERRGDAVRALAHEYRWARIGIHDDLFGRPRYALAFCEGD
ncbi:MAG: peptide chain release factor N(5)-glutamine methyltransferase [Gemmatimonadales bacterium]